MADPLTIKLKKPLKAADGESIKELVLREPVVSDLIAAEKFGGVVSKTIAMISSMTQIPIPVLNSMSLPDFRTCDNLIGDLVGNDRAEDGGTLPS